MTIAIGFGLELKWQYLEKQNSELGKYKKFQ